jgi:anti-sigma B factor antagonist
MLTTEIANDCLVVKLTAASLDATNANAFKDEVKATITPSIARVAVDLTVVEFMDSSGIGALLSIYKQMEGRMVLIKPQPTVLSILELLRLHRIFTIEPQGA